MNIVILKKGFNPRQGRNNRGRITSRHRGGGHKRLLRFVDFKRNKRGLGYVVCGFEYDPIRTANLALVKSKINGVYIYNYILCPKNLKKGDFVANHFLEGASFEAGSSYFLKHLPIGSFVHNIERPPRKGGQLARAAGCYAQVLQKGEKVLVKLPSNKYTKLSGDVRATFGVVGNDNHNLVHYGKAGRSRWLGRRPKVRGVAINPIDHPHGGGEGKSRIGRHPVSPWGWLTKGKKTK